MPYKDKEKKREHDKEYGKRYHKANREKRRAYMAAYYEANKEKCQGYCQRYRGREGGKEKARASQLKRDYGITIEIYNTLIDGQHFLCSICHKPDFEDGRPLHVDHCHKTGKVRGLLCNACNRGLGSFTDSPALLQRAIEYLHFHTDRITKQSTKQGEQP